MARDRKKSATKASKDAASDEAKRTKKARPAKPNKDVRSPRLDEKLARANDKRVRKLEGKLTEASRLERKQLRALESARRRRQLIEAALDELKGGRQAAPARGQSPAAPGQPNTEPAAAHGAVKTAPAARSAKPATTRTPRAPRRNTPSGSAAPAATAAPAAATPRPRRTGTKVTPKPEG
jgi:TolA-binding protein